MIESIYNLIQPKISGTLPGPKVVEVLSREGTSLSGPTIIPKYAEGVWIQDLDDNIFFDFISGRCVVNVGHRHPTIQTAILNQTSKVTYGTIEDLYLLNKKLDEILPLKGDGKIRVGYTLSGSTANDAAIKMARIATDKKGIICFAGAYHGTSYGALSISSYSPSMYKGYGRLSDIFYFPYPDYAHKPFDNLEPDQVDDIIIGLIQLAFETYMPPDDVAAIIFEPVAGDAGWLVPSKNFVKKLYKLAQENGVLFISDEVQTGFGRTGKWFCTENYDVKPDIIVMGKAMAGGAVAMAGVAAKQSIFTEGRRFSQVHTMGSHPLGVVATSANIDVIENEKLLHKSNINGSYVLKELKELEDQSDIVLECRGIASLIGVELSSKEHARKVIMECYKNGIHIVQMGYRGTGVLRIAPPLISTKPQLECAMQIIRQAIFETS